MRNLPEHSDSTDLLLDAMCNVFGVVLLVAIVIGGVSISNRITSPGKVDREVMVRAQSEYDLLVSQLQTEKAQRELLLSLKGKNTVDEKQETVDQSLVQSHRKILDKVNSLADRIEDVDRQIFFEKTYAGRLKNSSIDREKELIGKYKDAIQKKRKQRAVAYAVASAGAMVPWRILIDADKFYIIGTNQDIYQGSTANSAVSITSFRQNGYRFFRIAGRLEKGVPLQELNIQKNLPPADNRKAYFVELLTTPDAVSAAAGIIDGLRQKNIPFSWRIVPENGVMLRTAEEGNYEVSY